MATQGPMFWFDRGLLKVMNGTVNLESTTLKAVLLGSSQALDETFVGSSGDCRYADLTAELSTANGYTVGGVTLAGVTLSRLSALVAAWTSDPAVWTPSGDLTFKYFAILADNTNDDLLMACDMDTDGGTVTATSASDLEMTPNANGWGSWSR